MIDRMIHRRDFLRSMITLGAFAGLGTRAFAAPRTARPRPIPLGLLLDPDTPEGRGARLGFEESEHLGDLLHIRFVAAPTSRYALISLAAPKVAPAALFLAVAAPDSDAAPSPPWPHVYFVASSPAFRRQALGRHPDRKDLKVVDWQDGLMKFGAESLKLRYVRRFDQPMDEAAWRGWMAVKVATELALRFPGTRAGIPATENVENLRIDGHKGMPLRFDPEDHHLVQPVYLVDARGKVVDEVAPEWKE
jgi:hypothetical protein